MQTRRMQANFINFIIKSAITSISSTITSRKSQNNNNHSNTHTQHSQPKTNRPKSSIDIKMIAPQSSHSRLATVTAILTLSIMLIASIECHYFKRTQYHEQGLHGPKSYKFGFTAGDHKNPQERHEVSDGHGHVKGWYSFVDAYGKYQIVHYEAHPKYGFKVYNHKSKAYNNGKRHYNS